MFAWKNNAINYYFAVGGNHFDFVNWFYWAIWWQQCSYINPHYLTGFDIQPGVVPNQLAANTTWPRDGHQNVPNPLAGIGIQIRIISGEYDFSWKYVCMCYSFLKFLPSLCQGVGNVSI